MTQPGSNPPPRVLGPLWIISLFLGTSEIVVAVATTQASGWIQAMLAIFAVAFPTLVSILFFYTLWYNNKVLYAPRDFAEGTSVTEYVIAMSQTTRRRRDVVESALRAELKGQLEKLGTTDAQRDEILESVSTAARRTEVTVDITEFSPDAEPLTIPVDERSTVNELLDGVWFAISDQVDAYTYGKSWLLRDNETGRVFNQIGTRYARRQLRAGRDIRELTVVGIEPGASLSAIEPPR